MKTIKLDYGKSQIAEIVSLLKSGRVIVCPSETSYGLSVDATNFRAVEKINKIKGRLKSKGPFLIVVSSLSMAKKYAKFNSLATKIVKKYWPGPLTIVLPATSCGKKLKGIVNKDSTIAVRLTSNKFLKTLCTKLQRPLVSTSANISGQPDVYAGQGISSMYGKRKHKPSLTVDAGQLRKIKPSTLVRILEDRVEILRQGPIKVS